MSTATEIQRIQQAKSDLRTAIQAKGVTVPAATLIDGYAALVSQIPTGATARSRLVTGTFTARSTTGVQTIALDYTGSGYPIAAIVCLSDGLSSATNPTWVAAIQRYAVGCWSMFKNAQNTAPTYATSGTENAASTQCTYKNNTSGNASHLRGGDVAANTFSSSNAAASGNTCVRFRSATTLTVYISTTTYGLAPDFDYTYFIIYSDDT